MDGAVGVMRMLFGFETVAERGRAEGAAWAHGASTRGSCHGGKVSGADTKNWVPGTA